MSNMTLKTQVKKFFKELGFKITLDIQLVDQLHVCFEKGKLNCDTVFPKKETERCTLDMYIGYMPAGDRHFSDMREFSYCVKYSCESIEYHVKTKTAKKIWQELLDAAKETNNKEESKYYTKKEKEEKKKTAKLKSQADDIVKAIELLFGNIRKHDETGTSYSYGFMMKTCDIRVVLKFSLYGDYGSYFTIGNRYSEDDRIYFTTFNQLLNNIHKNLSFRGRCINHLEDIIFLEKFFDSLETVRECNRCYKPITKCVCEKCKHCGRVYWECSCDICSYTDKVVSDCDCYRHKKCDRCNKPIHGSCNCPPSEEELEIKRKIKETQERYERSDEYKRRQEHDKFVRDVFECREHNERIQKQYEEDCKYW